MQVYTQFISMSISSMMLLSITRQQTYHALCVSVCVCCVLESFVCLVLSRQVTSTNVGSFISASCFSIHYLLCVGSQQITNQTKRDDVMLVLMGGYGTHPIDVNIYMVPLALTEMTTHSTNGWQWWSYVHCFWEYVHISSSNRPALRVIETVILDNIN